MTKPGSGGVSVGISSPHVNAAGGGVGATANQAASHGRRSVVDVSEAGGSETTGDADSTSEAASAAEMEGDMNGESGSEDQAGRTEAAEANGVSDSEGAESGASHRGMWGAPQQPFPAAGSIPLKGEAAGTLISGDTAAVVVTDSGSTAGTTAAAAHDPAAEHLAVTAMETGSSQPLEGLQQAPATAQQTTATTESGALVSPELQQELALESTTQLPESTAQLPESTAQLPESTARPPESTAQPSESTAQPPVATATTSNEAAARPAAGQYRRVAWAPVHNPFPAAGLSGAIGKQPQLPALTDTLDIAKQQASTLSAVSNGEASSGDAMPGRSLTQGHVPDSIHGIQHVTESTSQAQAVSGSELESAEGLTHPADGSAAAEQHNPEESEAAECPPSHSMQQVHGEQSNLQLCWAYH